MLVVPLFCISRKKSESGKVLNLILEKRYCAYAEQNQLHLEVERMQIRIVLANLHPKLTRSVFSRCM